MRKCKVCGKLFKLRSKKRYEVVSNPVGLGFLVEKPHILECFDCPWCGCQNVVNVREVHTQTEEVDE